jgi:hypothetical protein
LAMRRSPGAKGLWGFALRIPVCVGRAEGVKKVSPVTHARLLGAANLWAGRLDERYSSKEREQSGYIRRQSAR